MAQNGGFILAYTGYINYPKNEGKWGIKRDIKKKIISNDGGINCNVSIT